MRWLALSVIALTVCYDVLAEVPAFCDLPTDHGFGDDRIVYLHYNKTRDQCDPFHYNGKGGNKNRFDTDRMCMRNCSSNAENVYPVDERESCHFHKAYGHCLSRHIRWFYDPTKGKCLTFHYTGCGGNGNRFLTESLCNSTCAGILDEGDMNEEDDKDTPVGLIIGILLGVVGTIILIVTIVLAVENTKPKTKETKSAQKVDDSPLPPEEVMVMADRTSSD